jgi:antitoxin ParD1/3/4
MNISWSPETEVIIQSQIQSGIYNSPEELIDAAVTLLDLLQREQRLEAIRQKITVGTTQIAEGRMTDGDVILDSLQGNIESSKTYIEFSKNYQKRFLDHPQQSDITMKPISNWRRYPYESLKSIFVIDRQMYILHEDTCVVCIEPGSITRELTDEPCVEVLEFSFDVKNDIGFDSIYIDTQHASDLIAMCESVGKEFSPSEKSRLTY